MPRKTLSLTFLRPRSPLQNSNASPSSPASPLPPPSSPGGLSTSSTASSPPTRLHLRTLISPALPRLFLATVPQTPYPWIWRCHLCGSLYRLGVTRRCLEDGHFFCSVPSPPPSPPPSRVEGGETDEESRLGTGFGGGVEKLTKRERENKQKRRERKRRALKGCRAEFDYSGWARYNNWRREVRAIKYSISLPASHRLGAVRHWQLSPIGGRENEVRERKDCWRDCDFPSECLNERIKERERLRQREIMRELEDEWRRERERLQELMDGDSTSDSRGEEMDLDGPEPEVKVDLDAEEETTGAETKVEGDTGEGEDNLGPVGTDCDGLGEASKEIEYTKCRRKSLDAAAEGEMQPSSPLKECSLGFEDVELGVNVWATKRRKGKEVEDVQMKEVGNDCERSLLLRRVGKGEAGEKFGDEVEER